MKNKKHIAMRCNQEQFEAIKPKLEKAGYEFDIYDFKIRDFLCNHLYNENLITNYSEDSLYTDKRVIHKEYNEKIFLEACGIETTPTLEEVKEYFKDADKCVSIQNTEFHNENWFWDSLYIDISKGIESAYINNGSFEVWNSKKGYAKILTYKTPKFEITKSQLEQLHRQGNDYTKFDLEYLFPLAFKEEKKELQKYFTGWVLDEESSKLIAYSEKGLLKYGFDFHEKWIEDTNVRIKNERKATSEEVTEALKKEAVRRYKVGDLIKNFEGYFNAQYYNNMLFGGECFCIDSDGSFCVKSTNNFWIRIMSKEGIWAEIIPTKTIQEAEEFLKEFGHEIKIVS